MYRALLLALLLHSPQFVFAQFPEAHIKKIIQEKQIAYPEVGMVISISDSSGLLFEEASGFANLSFQLKAKPEHRFKIGSLTKQFTAVAILKLMEEGKLNLSDSLQQFFPKYPYEGHRVTVAHLLSHTSGIPDYINKADWFTAFSKQAVQPLELVEYFKTDSLVFEPGTNYSYNNSGYHLLGCIIEKVSGMPYSQYMSQNIFQPLGMEQTLCYDSPEVISDLVEGYDVHRAKKVEAEYLHPSQPFSAGNIVSNTADIRKWYKGLFSGEIISKEVLQLALKPYPLKDGTYTHYGFGWELDSLSGKPFIRHGGSIPGYNSEVLYFPDNGLLVVGLSNYLPMTYLVKKLGAVARNLSFIEPAYIELKQDEVSAYTAAFGSGQEFWQIFEKDGRIFYTLNQGMAYEIKPINEKRFYSTDWDVWFEFADKKEGGFQTFYLDWNGVKSPFPRTKTPAKP